MICAPFPQDEAARLRLLSQHGLLDATPDPFLDALVVTVARSFRAPMAAVSLIGRDDQFFKARVGLEPRSTKRDCSFCAHILWWPAPLVVLDTHEDERFADNPLVTGAPHLRFYAGTPLHLRGLCIGALCILDHRPRVSFGEIEQRLLAGAAMAVEERLIQMTTAPG